MKRTSILSICYLTSLLFGCSIQLPDNFLKSISEVVTSYEVTANGKLEYNLISPNDEGRNYILQISEVPEDILSNNSLADISSISSLIVFRNLNEDEFNDSDKIVLEISANNSITIFDYQKELLTKFDNHTKITEKFIQLFDDQNYNECINMLDMNLIGVDSTSLLSIFKSIEVTYGELEKYRIYGLEKGSELINGEEIDFYRIKILFNYENTQRSGILAFTENGKLVGINM